MEFFRFLFSRTFLRQLLYAMVLVAAIIGGLWFYLKAYTDHGNYVSVPSLEGLSLEDAQSKLEALHLSGALVDSVWSPKSQPGMICEQSPAPGEKVKSGRQVYLTSYRFKPSFVKIGVEQGERKNVAMIRLENKGIAYDVSYEPHELLYDCVIRVEHQGKPLTAQDEVRRDERVRLVVGERRQEKVAVPRLFGMSLDNAIRTLNLASLTLGFAVFDQDILTPEDSVQSWIYEQQPGVQSRGAVRVGTEVNVWLTKRPKPVKGLATDSLSKPIDDHDDLFD